MQTGYLMLNEFDKKNNPFKVPENYFSDFTNQIMDKIPAERAEKSKKIPLWKNVLPPTAIAAAVCGVLFCIGIFKKANVENTNADNSYVYVSTTTTYEDDYYQFLEDEYTEDNLRNFFYGSMYN